MKECQDKTIEQLITELTVLHQQIAGVKVSGARWKQVEVALRESEEKYRSIFNEARDNIVLIDSETGNIIDCNPEFEHQTGRSLEKLRGMKIWELRPPEQIDAARKTFLKIREKGIGSSAELDFQKPDGEIISIEFLSKAGG